MQQTDGPSSPLFRPAALEGNITLKGLRSRPISDLMRRGLAAAPTGRCVAWGIPFQIGKVVLLVDKPVQVRLQDIRGRWLVFLHTSDAVPQKPNADGFVPASRGKGQLGQLAARYIIIYSDGSEIALDVRRRYEIGFLGRQWGETCFAAVSGAKPYCVWANPDDLIKHAAWARYKAHAFVDDHNPWVNWLWAWENPCPHKPIRAIRFEPVSGAVVVSAISAGDTKAMPMRWQTRQKALLTLPRGEQFDPAVSANGLLRQIQLDLGQVISARPQSVYPNGTWSRTCNNDVPDVSTRHVLVEYAAHPDARFHFLGGKTLLVAKVQAGIAQRITPVAPADRRVTIRVVDRATGKEVPVKLHVHGQAGEYLAPIDRHRIINTGFFEDYSADFSHLGRHDCTYIPGRTRIDLPVGKVYVEVSKGFEIRPVRRVCRVGRDTREIVIELDKVLPWRERGWVTADTHVHFLSPHSAMLEGAGEGVNVVNLLASQWGELVTNVGDFDGQGLLGRGATLGNGEYMVRVGTENRQHILGHISLLGYDGAAIARMTTGGPDESAVGDAVEALMTDWARQCRKQKGLVVIPHFPNPRGEAAACIVGDVVDAVEMTSWGNLYGGIDPYSLSDWYRFLNCGYRVAAVGGTDKMLATTPVGAVRTYARIPPGRRFDYDAWKDAIRRGETFVTYGPLMEFAVDGSPAGSQIEMSPKGGTVDVTWQAASCTVSMSRVELVVNGEIRESLAVDPWQARGAWPVKVGRSSWLALLIRGRHKGKPEIIAAHSSPVMVRVKGSEFSAAADALTILEQIEGVLAYVDTVATRAQVAEYRRMRLVLTAAHRSVHNRMHRLGQYHHHTPTLDHAQHESYIKGRRK